MANKLVSPLPLVSGSGRITVPVSDKSPLFYGLGVLGFNLILEAFGGYAYFFYIEILGLAMTMAAVVRMAYAIWDSINDPIFGFLSDNTRSLWGRRHVWLVPTTLLSGIVFILVFSVPEFIQGKTHLFWYMLVTLLLFETLSTILIVNYVALFPEYFQGLKKRSTASVYNQAGKNIAVLIGLALTPIVYRAIGFTWMAVTYSLLSIVLLVLSLVVNREDPQMQVVKKVEFLPAFKNVLKDLSFWKYGITIALILFGVNMVPFALPFYVKYALNAGPNLTATLSGMALVTSLVVLPIWGRLIRKWEMKKTFYAVVLIMAFGAILLGFSPNKNIAMAGIVIYGVAWGGIWVCNHIIRADLISQNQAHSEKHTEALYYSLLNVILRIGGLLQSLAMVLATVFFGYVSGENPGSQPGMAFRFLMGFIPLVGLVVALFFARFFFKDYPALQSA